MDKEGFAKKPFVSVLQHYHFDNVDQYVDDLKNSTFGKISVMNIATIS